MHRSIPLCSIDTVPSLQTLCAIAIVLLASALRLDAQTIRSVGNRFIQANADMSSNAGRFWIESNGTKFLYRQTNFITSNIVFKITRNGTDSYYCNLPVGAQPAWRPMTPQGDNVPFKAIDSIYSSADTMAFTWKDLDGFRVTMRFIPEKPSALYDSGGDILIEFSYSLLPFKPAGTLGILMMLDAFNSDAQGTYSGDRVSILTSRGYLPSDDKGRVFTALDTIPEFYHTGNLLHETPLNTILPVHRLSGASHNGTPLSQPSYFAVGSWRDFRTVAWAGDPGQTNVGDAATIVRWDNLSGAGTIRTAFGLSDQGGNDLFTCRDSSLFVDIRTIRVVQQQAQDGPYLPAQWDLEMWVTNTSMDSPAIGEIMSSIASLPGNSSRIVIDPNTSPIRQFQLAPRQTRKLSWRLNLNPSSDDTLARLDFKYRLTATGQFRPFAQGCMPSISVRGFSSEDTADATPPTIDRVGVIDGSIGRWLFQAIDRRSDNANNSGIDSLWMIADQSFNVSVSVRTYRRCDADVYMEVVIADTTKAARLVVAARDCAGNPTLDTTDFEAIVLDRYPPVIDLIDSTIGGRPGWILQAHDRHDGNIYDLGIDSVWMMPHEFSQNTSFEVRNYTECAVDSSVWITVRIGDTTVPASIIVGARDCAGNIALDTLSFAARTGSSSVDAPGRKDAFAIVSVRPQPVVAAQRARIDITFTGAASGSLRGEIFSLDGRTAVAFELSESESRLGQANIELPAQLAPGVYLLRLSGSHGAASMKIVVE